MKKFWNQIVPFLILGVALVAFAFGIIILAYLFFIGALVGGIIFLAAWIRERLFPTKKPEKDKIKPTSGRIIDSDDWKKL